MRRRVTFLMMLCIFCALTAQAQTFLPDSMQARSIEQCKILPQEKLYIHTDKSTYIAGEKIWLRAYTLDGISHDYEEVSRYVYVELQDPFMKTLKRVKLKKDEEGHIYGHIPLSEELPTGEYILTAYTRYMETLGEDYFFRKRLFIANVMNKSIRMETRMDNTYLYVKLFNPVTGEPQSVKDCIAQLPSGQIDVQRSDNDFRIKIHEEKEHTVLVQVGNYKEFVPIAARPDYDVTFHPEGGNLPAGALCRIAFKALNEQGQGEDVTGSIRNESDSIIVEFKSIHRGMGAFSFIPESGQKYYAICENAAGKTKTFDLPRVEEQAITLQVNRVKDKVYAKVLHNPLVIPADSFFVFVHQRGWPKHISVWKSDMRYHSFDVKDFTSGSASFLLVDAQGRTVSERMVFIEAEDFARANVVPDTVGYGPREKMTLDLDVTDAQGNPWNGNCSVAITDNADVQADSCLNILSTLLLTSDLKGYVEEPAWYFGHDNTGMRQRALDVLMMTQGWKKYNWQRVWRADYDTLTVLPEQSQVIAGKVTKRMLDKPIENADVQLMSMEVGLSGNVQTGADGAFRFEGFEYPDSTSYWVSAYTSRGKDNVVVHINGEAFPTLTKKLPHFRSLHPDTPQDAISNAYLNKADLRMIMEDGIRHIFMDEVLVTASKKVYKTEYERIIGAKSIKEEQLAKSGALDLRTLFQQLIPGFTNVTQMSSGGGKDEIIKISNSRALVLIDGIMMNSDQSSASNDAVLMILNTLNPSDIEQIDVIKGPQVIGIHSKFQAAIAITTKRGGGQYNAQWPVTNLKTVMPLGYQEPVSFYSPKYDTVLRKESKNPDLRTTIHW